MCVWATIVEKVMGDFMCFFLLFSVMCVLCSLCVRVGVYAIDIGTSGTLQQGGGGEVKINSQITECRVRVFALLFRLLACAPHVKALW